MGNKIAIITTDFLVDYIHSAFSRMQLDCDYELFIYKNFKDIPDLYRTISGDIKGVLTSGSFPARVINLSFPNTHRVIIPFNTDDAAICQMFFRLLDENRFLNFDRIYADLVEMFDIDLKTYLMHDFSIPLSIKTDQIVFEKGLDELFEIEEKEYQKHLKLWKSGTIDLCVTRFSSLVERLKEQKIPVYFPYPSIGYLRETCLKLFKEIEYRQLQDNSSAIINISLLKEEKISQEYQLVTLQAALMEFMGETSLDYFLGRNSFGIEILTNRKTIENLTNGYRVCQIKNWLSQNVNFSVCIGYGIGQDLQQARTNARKASLESQKSSIKASFVMNEYGVLMGPLMILKQKVMENIASKTAKQETKKMVIAEYKIKEVLSVIRETSKKQITSQELADKLGITKRSANRILSAMEENSIIEVIKTRQTSAKGRPERVYQEIE